MRVYDTVCTCGHDELTAHGVVNNGRIEVNYAGRSLAPTPIVLHENVKNHIALWEVSPICIADRMTDCTVPD